MNKFQRVFLFAVCLWLLALPAAVAEDTQTLLIGYSAPLAWRLPTNSLLAIQQAILEANARNHRINGKKLQFQLVTEDDKSDPRVAQFVAKSLVKAGVMAVIGHWSSDTTLAAAPIYADANVLQFNPTATAAEITQQGYQSNFQMVGNDDSNAQCLVDYVMHVMQAKRIALIDDGSIFGKNLAQAYAEKLNALHGNVVITESVSSKTSDFNAPLKRIKNADVDVILFCGTLTHSGDLARAMKRLQVPGKLFLPGGATSKVFLDLVAGADMSTLLTIEPALLKGKSPSWKQFQANYQKGPNWDVSPFSMMAYDAIGLIVKGIQHSNSTDPKKIAEALHKISFEGLSGRIAFEANGERINPLYTVYGYDSGQWLALKTYGN